MIDMNEEIKRERQVVSIDSLMPFLIERIQSGQSVRFSPRGISMLPMIRQEIDSVVLSPVSGKLKKYDLPLYRRDNGNYILHRIVRVGKTYTCIGDNQFDLEKGIEHGQVLAVVTAFYRGDKLHSTNELGYRLYCRFWHYSRFPRHVWRSLRYRTARLWRRIFGKQTKER